MIDERNEKLLKEEKKVRITEKARVKRRRLKISTQLKILEKSTELLKTLGSSSLERTQIVDRVLQ